MNTAQLNRKYFTDRQLAEDELAALMESVEWDNPADSEAFIKLATETINRFHFCRPLGNKYGAITSTSCALVYSNTTSPHESALNRFCSVVEMLTARVLAIGLLCYDNRDVLGTGAVVISNPDAELWFNVYHRVCWPYDD